jgi:hypothetical protein
MGPKKKCEAKLPETDVEDPVQISRKRRQFYLLGFPLQAFAPNRLPTNGEMLRRFYWLNIDKKTRYY